MARSGQEAERLSLPVAGVEQVDAGGSEVADLVDVVVEGLPDEEEIDDVASPVVDLVRRQVRIGAGMQLLGDLVVHGDASELDGGWQSEVFEGSGRHELDPFTEVTFVGCDLDVDGSPGGAGDGEFDGEPARFDDASCSLDDADLA